MLRIYLLLQFISSVLGSIAFTDTSPKPPDKQMYNWFPTKEYLQRVNKGDFSNFPWRLSSIGRMIQTGNETFSEHDLCATPWAGDKFSTDRKDWKQLSRPFGYQRSKVITCSEEEGRYSVRLRNMPLRFGVNFVGGFPTEDTLLVTEARQEAVRIFCYHALNIAHELLNAIGKDRLLIEEHARKSQEGDILSDTELGHYNRGDEDGTDEFLANEDFEVVGISWWTGDLTWQVVIGREKNDCPQKGKVNLEKEWNNYVDFSDASKIPGFNTSENGTAFG